MKKPRPWRRPPDLPDVIWFQILGRLPVLAIVRCRAVCKKWKSLISDREFGSYHRSLIALSNTRRSLFLRRLTLNEQFETVGDVITLHSDQEDFSNSTGVRSPFNDLYEDPNTLRYLGSVDGAICVCAKPATDEEPFLHIYIWNPSVRRSIQLPDPSLPLKYADLVLGFGCDSQRNQYKVVRLSYYRKSKTWEAEVCSIDGSVWRLVPNVSQVLKDYKGVTRRWSQCCVDGTVYIVPEMMPMTDIIAFDVDEESFSIVKLPENLQLKGRIASVCEMKFDGMLTVTCAHGASRDILVKNNDGWVRLYTIDVSFPDHKILVGLWHEKKVLLERRIGETSRYTLNFYDPETSAFEDLGIQNVYDLLPAHSLGDTFFAMDYTEGLVLLASDQIEADPNAVVPEIEYVEEGAEI